MYHIDYQIELNNNVDKIDIVRVELTVNDVVINVWDSIFNCVRSLERFVKPYLEPLLGILFSVIFVGETLTSPQIIGGVLLLGSTP